MKKKIMEIAKFRVFEEKSNSELKIGYKLLNHESEFENGNFVDIQYIMEDKTYETEILYKNENLYIVRLEMLLYIATHEFNIQTPLNHYDSILDVFLGKFIDVEDFNIQMKELNETVIILQKFNWCTLEELEEVKEYKQYKLNTNLNNFGI